jgi:hypothetical protein
MSEQSSNQEYIYLNLSGQSMVDKLAANFVEAKLSAQQLDHMDRLMQKVMAIPNLRPGQQHGEEAVGIVGAFTVLLANLLPGLGANIVVLPEDMRPDMIQGVHFFMYELCPDVALFIWNNGELRTLTPEDEVNPLDEIEEIEDRKVH